MKNPKIFFAMLAVFIGCLCIHINTYASENIMLEPTEILDEQVTQFSEDSTKKILQEQTQQSKNVETPTETVKSSEKPTPTESVPAEKTSMETAKPTVKPTTKPTAKPTAKPTTKPTTNPTAKPTVKPTVKPTESAPSKPAPTEPITPKVAGYDVYVNGIINQHFTTYEEALTFAKTQENASILNKEANSWVWSNYPLYNVFTSNDEYMVYNTFAEAVQYAKQQESFIIHTKDNSMVWSNTSEVPEAYQIKGVPKIYQNPELPRGCEVTSLAMLLQYKGVDVSKTTLAKEIDKVPYKYTSNGKTYHGNPNEGFVGDMYNMSNDGWGVYHKPIHKLLSQYFPDSSVDLTGCEFEDLYYFISHDTPVWVVVNTKFKALPSSSFETWQTNDGPMNITWAEHSVLVTGYDENNIYFNDPLGNASSASKSNFIAAWEQMGKQAVTVSR